MEKSQYTRKWYRFRDWSIRRRLGIPIFTALAILILNFTVSALYQEKQIEADEWGNNTSKLRSEVSQVYTDLSLLWSASDQVTEQKIRGNVNEIDHIISILRSGGETSVGKSSNHYVISLPTKLQPDLENTSLSFKAFKKDLNGQLAEINKYRSRFAANDSLQQLVLFEMNGKARAELAGMSTLTEDVNEKIDILSEKILAHNRAVKDDYRLLRIFTTLLTALAVLMVFFFIIRYIVKPVRQLSEASLRMAKGDNSVEIISKNNDEIGDIIHATLRMSENLQYATEFTKKIGEGNYNAVELHDNYDEADNHDTLLGALVRMRDRLKAVNEEEEQRSWTSQGLALFADILRKGDESEFKTFGNQIISELTSYVGANQGGLFLLQENSSNDKEIVHLELVACYAYGKQKFLNKTVEINKEEGFGEGIIGQAFLEGNIITPNKLPEGYSAISSGLGESEPSELWVVPMKVGNRSVGVIELASFTPLEKYRVDFVEKIAESIASSIMTARANKRTRDLLKESQFQAEAMRAQEEEMRQNMEELQATQEEMRRKQNQLIENERRNKIILETSSDAIFVLDTTGKIESANNASSKIFGYAESDLQGKNVNVLLDRKQLRDVENLLELDKRELIGYHRNGEQLFLDIQISEIEIEGNRQLVLFFRDSTLRRKQEEEIRKNLAESEEKQAELEASQKAIEEKNKKMTANEGIMRKALSKLQSSENAVREKNKELDEAHKELRSQEEELRQNMEELVATQEEMKRRQGELESSKQELERNNEKMKANELVLKKAFERLKKSESLARYKNKEVLEAQEAIAVKETELRKKLELLQETENAKAVQQEELDKVQRKLEKQNRQLRANEEILKKAFLKLKNAEKTNSEKVALLEKEKKELEGLLHERKNGTES